MTGPEWLYAAREAQFTTAEYAALLRSIADSLSESNRLQINSYVLDVPEAFEIYLRVERTPHGTRALIIRTEWPEATGGSAVVGSARNIRIAPVDAPNPGGGSA